MVWRIISNRAESVSIWEVLFLFVFVFRFFCLFLSLFLSSFALETDGSLY